MPAQKLSDLLNSSFLNGDGTISVRGDDDLLPLLLNSNQPFPDDVAHGPDKVLVLDLQATPGHTVGIGDADRGIVVGHDRIAGWIRKVILVEFKGNGITDRRFSNRKGHTIRDATKLLGGAGWMDVKDKSGVKLKDDRRVDVVVFGHSSVHLGRRGCRRDWLEGAKLCADRRCGRGVDPR